VQVTVPACGEDEGEEGFEGRRGEGPPRAKAAGFRRDEGGDSGGRARAVMRVGVSAAAHRDLLVVGLGNPGGGGEEYRETGATTSAPDGGRIELPRRRTGAAAQGARRRAGRRRSHLRVCASPPARSRSRTGTNWAMAVRRSPAATALEPEQIVMCRTSLGPARPPQAKTAVALAGHNGSARFKAHLPLRPTLPVRAHRREASVTKERGADSAQTSSRSVSARDRRSHRARGPTRWRRLARRRLTAAIERLKRTFVLRASPV